MVVDDVADEAAYVPALEAAGSSCGSASPATGCCAPRPDAHLHFFEPGHQAIAAYLDLRGRLRSDPADRDLYAATKRGSPPASGTT